MADRVRGVVLPRARVGKVPVVIPRTVKIVCADAPAYVVYVPAVRHPLPVPNDYLGRQEYWTCSRCGARVKVAW